ncbi:MAG: glycoside hydrolase family 38 C-terminal domain-containing protein [Candidatus Heimdallarchaeaceae archaeon]
MTSDKIFIVPHTHWDREWYLPFQTFRYKLVDLIDNLLEIMEDQDYYFMLDGQTIVIEDYLEIRPEKKETLLELIREGRIAVGPWFLLPDEWLVGGESLIRNLETSFDLAQKFNIPLMDIAYLPDQFGHSRVIPQIITDLTNFKAAVLWRGVGKDVVTVPFHWKSHSKASSSLFSVYMPHGYGNAAGLSGDPSTFKEELKEHIDELLQYSPVPVYLLMNGTDHQFPNPRLINTIKFYTEDDRAIKLSLLNDYIESLIAVIKQKNYLPQEHKGEFRSSATAPLLQDTYSTRIWIKQWNQKIEDLLVNYTEPIATIMCLHNAQEYPMEYINLAWKWLLKNHTHDGICGCSIDQVHEEMKTRFHWAESLASGSLDKDLLTLQNSNITEDNSQLLAFNPTNSPDIPMLVKFAVPSNMQVQCLLSEDDIEYEVQTFASEEDVIFDITMSPIMLRSGMKMLPGRKLIDDYLNEAHIHESNDPNVCEFRLVLGKEPIEEFDITEMKKQVQELLDSKKYKKYHIKATRGTNQTYGALIPIQPFSFSRFQIKQKKEEISTDEKLIFTKNNVENEFYRFMFKRDGSVSLFDKKHETLYENFHFFEDFGDRGDEYSFGRVLPELAKPLRVKRRIVTNGPLVYEIKQTMLLKIKKELNDKRDGRSGDVLLPITTYFTFYKNLPRIDFRTELVNYAKDHRLRICFETPYYNFQSLTSTHFGVVERKTEPIGDDSYVEAASGIQAQKRFIRLEDKKGNSSLTLINKGLPEIEVVKGKRIALTLLRSIGYLSRSDFPERPIHAGPFLETPGAQELNNDFEYEYSVVLHSKEDPMYISSNYSEVASLKSKSAIVEINEKVDEYVQPILRVENQWIRISSLRMKNGKIRVTLFNLDENKQNTSLMLNRKLKFIQQIKIDSSSTKQKQLTTNQFEITFNPFEIVILEFE